MKLFFISIFILSSAYGAKAPDISEAPLEWLIVQTIHEKIDDHGHIHHDKLVDEIFEAVHYDPETDEIIPLSNKRTFELRKKLIRFVKKNQRRSSFDPLYYQWKNEGRSPRRVDLDNVRKIEEDGFYFFNHIHTNISQDNSSLKFLKISPEKTVNLVKGFLKKRKARGVMSINDHDTDRGFEDVKGMMDSTLEILRAIEWGGSTHMGLIDIKPNWELLSRGREFKHQDSIIKSRSSEGFRILNHPAKKSGFPPSQWLDVDGVEVWNTIMEDSFARKLPLKKSNNREALAQWEETLRSGKQYTAVGGSDFHFIIPCLRDRSLHYPANYFPTDNGDSVKEQLKDGRNSIVNMPNAPKLRLLAKYEGDGRYAEMGDTLNGTGKLEVLLTANFDDAKVPMRSVCYNVIGTFTKLLTFWKKKRWEVRFYNKAGSLVAKQKVKPRKYGPKKSFKVSFDIDIQTDELVRAELWSINKKKKEVDLLAFTNPIYLKAN